MAVKWKPLAIKNQPKAPVGACAGSFAFQGSDIAKPGAFAAAA